jgi:hypothetical protein
LAAQPAFVTQLAIEDGSQFFTQQLLEPERTNTRARIGAAPRFAVTSIGHRAYQSCRADLHCGSALRAFARGEGDAFALAKAMHLVGEAGEMPEILGVTRGRDA